MSLKNLRNHNSINILRHFPNTNQIKALIKKQLVIKIAAMLVCINCFNFCYAQQNQEHIIGKWMSLRKNVIVEVFKTGNEYKGV